MSSDRLFFGRRVGKGFSRVAAWPLCPKDEDLIFSDPQNLADLPHNHRVLEIGFGNGMHILAMASAYPESLCVGVDAYQTGFSHCLRLAITQNLRNIRLACLDIGPMLDRLPRDFFDQIFILFPDPWPKTRHHKRRLVTETFLRRLAASLKTSGHLILATDDATYAEVMRLAISKALPHGIFLNPEPLIVTTPYGQKAINHGRKITQMTVSRP